jgi:hypothetical protein
MKVLAHDIMPDVSFLPSPHFKFVPLDDVFARCDVVSFHCNASRDGKPVFVVRNSWRQDLGVIDRLGRAYRFRPHAEEPDWLGTGTVEGGAARILEAASVELQEIDLTAAQASTFNLWASSEVRAQEAGAKRETPSPEPPDRGGEIPQLPEGTPQ